MDVAKRTLMRNNEPVPLTPKVFDLLLILIENNHRVIEKDELMTLLWPDSFVDEANLTQNISVLRKALGDPPDHRQYIRTAARQGYRFIAPVRCINVVSAVKNEGGKSPVNSEGEVQVERHPTTESIEEQSIPISRVFISSLLPEALGGHRWYALIISLLYASLFTIELFVEIAYKADLYSEQIINIAPFAFLGMLISSLVALRLDWILSHQNKSGGLVISVSIFLIATSVICGVLWFFLPSSPVTEASFRTLTGQVAYLKTAFSFFLIALVLLAPTFHFILVMQKELESGKYEMPLALLTSNFFTRRKLLPTPNSTIYPRLWALIIAAIIIDSIAIGGYVRLTEHLIPSPFINLFGHLLLIRLIVYLLLQVFCLAWYYQMLNEVRLECLYLDTQNRHRKRML